MVKDKKNGPDNQSLSRLMRLEWDRRIEHDYRYWMSDGVESDEEMWLAGKRDFDILLEGLNQDELRGKTALEIGCGVGRILRAASSVFAKVLGVDVSVKGIEEAKRLLRDLDNVELVCGNGLDLSFLESDSIDFAYTFAALSSMPVKIIASYLAELSRVLKPGGIARLQVYLGALQETAEQDTIAIRSFDRGRFVAAVQGAGFVVESTKELVLPFEISDHEAGLAAEIVSLTKTSSPRLETGEILEILAPGGERPAEVWQGARTEFFMAITRAQQHLDARRISEAKTALEFARKHYSGQDEDARALLTELEQSLSQEENQERGKTEAPCSTDSSFVGVSLNAPDHLFDAEVFEKNLNVLCERFPVVHQQLVNSSPSNMVAVKQSSSGAPVILVQGQPLDQLQKPVRAGEVWAERALNSEEAQRANTLVVAGFAGGYHVEALGKLCDKDLHVVEPRIEVLRASLGARDCRECLVRLAALSTSLEDFRSQAAAHLQTSAAQLLIHPQTQALSTEIVNELRRMFWDSVQSEKLLPSIAVVGPVYGGSLPIAHYAARALKMLGQRVQYYELGDFYKPFKQIEAILTNPRRVDAIQNNYVEMLSDLVLEGITERPIDILICLAQAPLTGRVLTEMRRRGIITVMWFVEDCRRFQTWQQIARYYDYMFLIQRDEMIDMVEQAGAGRAVYLPLGCDPGIHLPLELAGDERKRWGSQVSFLGAGYNNRQQMFAALARRDFKIWGTEWPTCTPFDKLVQEKGRRISPEDYVKIFNSSAINLNLHSSKERDGVEPYGDFVNPRTFELAGCGVFQLIDNRTLLPELFEIGSELVTFSDLVELEQKIDYYLSHPDERDRIARASRERVLKEHTYVHRMEKMLDCIIADKYDYLRTRANEGPWPKTLSAAKQYPELLSRLNTVYENGMDPQLANLVANIETGKRALTDVEQKLLFFHYLKKEIAYVGALRKGE